MWEQNIVLKILRFEFNKLGNFLGSFAPVINSTYLSVALPVIVIMFILVVVSLTYFFIRLYLFWKESNKPCIFFEVIPLTTTEQSAFTTTQLFSGVHGLLKQRQWIYKLLDLYKLYSFEIVSTKERGIRYILRVPADDAQIIKKSLIAYLPGIQVKEVENYLKPSPGKSPRVIEFKLANHFSYPLKKQDKLEEYDPIAYITSTMTKLTENETVSFQMVVSPVNNQVSRQVEMMHTVFIQNGDTISWLSANSFISKASLVISIIFQILILPIGLVIWFFTLGREGPMLPIFEWNPAKDPPVINKYKEIMETQIKNKLDEPLFSVALRLFTSTELVGSAIQIEKGFIAALAPFANADVQAFKPKQRLRLSVLDKYGLFLFKNRLLSITNKPILSASEISDLYHFPYTSTTKTENISKLHSKELPLPTLAGYYRLLTGISQKGFYKSSTGMGAFKSMESRGLLTSRTKELIPEFCEKMSIVLSDLIRTLSSSLSHSDIHDLQLLTLGSNFYGSTNNTVGTNATNGVLDAIAEVYKEYITEKSLKSLKLTSPEGKHYTVTLSSDPDVVLREITASDQRNILSIEIKGGSDASNVYNRGGEAEKSHQGAKQRGYSICWTIIRTNGIDFEKLKRGSPTTDLWVDTSQVLAHKGSDWNEFSKRLIALLA